MRFAACLKKDIRLLTGGGLRSLLFLALPVALVFLMMFGMSGVASGDAKVESFSIAVRDNDDTVMSRLLMTQLDSVSIFDKVIRAGDAADEELLEQGCAAIVTIPKDLFYDLYDMEDTDVIIALNSNMPAQADMVRSAFSSLVGVLEENQRLYYAAARIRYGDLGDEQMREIYHDYSNASAEDVLGRLTLFDLTQGYEREYDAKKLFFGASVISMLIMFIPLSMLRSVPEELEDGLSARYKAAGGSLISVMLSKLAICFVMTFIPVVLMILILGLGKLGVLLPTLLVLFAVSFAFFLFIGCVSKNASTAQLLGNIAMLLMLTLGGGLLPASLLPGSLGKISKYTLPGLISSVMQQAYIGRSLTQILPGLMPFLAAAAVFLIISIPFFGRRRRA